MVVAVGVVHGALGGLYLTIALCMGPLGALGALATMLDMRGCASLGGGSSQGPWLLVVVVLVVGCWLLLVVGCWLLVVGLSLIHI